MGAKFGPAARYSSPPLRLVRCLCAAAVASLLGRRADAAAAAGAAAPPRSGAPDAVDCLLRPGAPDAVDCLLRAAAAGVRVLARSAGPVDLVPGCVSLVRNADGPAGEDAAAAAEAGAVSAEAAFVDSLTAFAGSRAISVRAPASLLDALNGTLLEARGKKDKYARPLLIGAMMVAGTLLPIKLGALAMMSGKALMTSVLALVLAAILALKKLASGGGGGGGHSGTTYEVINVPTHGGAQGPHRRSLSRDPAHDLAYGPPPVDSVAATTTGAPR